MTKAKARDYQIQYTDQSYRIIDWTKAEWEKVCSAMESGKKVIALDDGLFALHDIRTIVRLPEPPKEEEVKKEEQSLSEWGFVDHATAEWLRQVGIEVSK